MMICVFLNAIIVINIDKRVHAAVQRYPKVEINSRISGVYIFMKTQV